jgi:large subunit ribosomal protein L24
MKLKVGDTVKITSGRDRGQTGPIERVLPVAAKVVITGRNLYKKHIKARGGRPGEIADVARPVPVGNIALICPKCKQVTRIGYSLGKDGSKVRICRKCKASV